MRQLVGIVCFMRLEGVTDGKVGRDSFRTVRPLGGNGNGAEEAVVGILYAYTGIMHHAVMCAICSEGIEAVKEVVGGCQIMLSEDIVSKVKAGDRGEIGGFLHVGDTDEGHVRFGMTLGDFAANDVPHVVVLRFVEDAATIELWDEGDPAIAWGDVGLQVEGGVSSIVGVARDVEVEVACERCLDAASGEIGVVEVIEVDFDEGTE